LLFVSFAFHVPWLSVIRNVLKHSENVALVFLELPGYRLKFANAGEMHHTVTNFYQIPYVSLKDAVWPAMRAKTGIFNGYSDRKIEKHFWPSDRNHVGLWGHHALVDTIAYMIEFESSPSRASLVEEPEPNPENYSPVEEVLRDALFVPNSHASTFLVPGVSRILGFESIEGPQHGHGRREHPIEAERVRIHRHEPAWDADPT
jgi:hypothetical protein